MKKTFFLIMFAALAIAFSSCDRSSPSTVMERQYLFIPELESTGLVIAVTSTRPGGISTKPYEFLNLAYYVGDSFDAVTANRKIFADDVGINIERLVTCKEVHSSNVFVVTEAHCGMGSMDYETAIDETDALITQTPNVPLGMHTADCVPIFILEPEVKAIGIAHAGWRGTLDRIAVKTIQKMESHFGAIPKNCLVGFGPAIGACCYEVGDDMVKQFQKSFGPEVFPAPRKLNLFQANRKQLIEIGVLPENIFGGKLCTACNTELFYSHHAENGRTGRMMSVIQLIK